MSLVCYRLRLADRPWFEEFDDLVKLGFEWHFDGHDWKAPAAYVCICCGEVMDFRGFERGDVAYRAYALCVMCGWWMEF